MERVRQVTHGAHPQPRSNSIELDSCYGPEMGGQADFKGMALALAVNTQGPFRTFDQVGSGRLDHQPPLDLP